MTVTAEPDTRLADTAPPAGYWVDTECGAWRSLPWPDDVAELPPSLGWGMIAWAESFLVHHLTGAPWRYTKAQKRFIVLWYAVDSDGRWLYRRGVMRRAKGVGKDPLGATMLHAEGFGPAVFAGFNDRGEPVGRPRRTALVQIAANSEEQGKDLLFVANAMVSKRLKREVGFEPGKLASASKSGVRMQILTNSVATAEGDPADFIVVNENHHMTDSNGGRRLAAVVRRNLAKSPDGQARAVELTNAWEPGAASEAESTYEAWQAQVQGKTLRADILYDSCEAPAYLSLHTVSDVDAGLRAAYADAPWVSLERIAAEIDDTSQSVADSIRFYFNQLAVNESSWIDPRNFDAGALSEVVDDGEHIALFLDCSKSDDVTVLEGARISDGYAFHIGGWQRPHGDRGKGWLAPRQQVDACVRDTFDRYKVDWFGVDPSPARDDETEASYWLPFIDRWAVDLGRRVKVKASERHVFLFDMRAGSPGGRERNRLFTESAMTVAQAIDESHSFRHDGHPMLRMHVHNAHRRTNQWGVSLGKMTRDSKNKVDAAVGMVGAQLGRTLVLRSGKHRGPSRIMVHRW